MAETKDIILELFSGITLIDRYGLSEQVASAVSVNKGYYHFYESYSKIELFETDLMNGSNKIKEIIGTNLTNKAMPLIRYGVSDFVEVDENNNIVSIIGRTNDFVINSKRNVVPAMALLRSKTKENVIAFQYFQDKIGELVIKVKVNERFKEEDRKLIYEDMTACFQGLMQIKIEITKDLKKGNNGKLIRCIQLLDLQNLC